MPFKMAAQEMETAMRMIGALSLLAVCGLLAAAPANADGLPVPPFKGNDTGGIIAYSLTSQTDIKALAIDHCARYGKVVKFLAAQTLLWRLHLVRLQLGSVWRAGTAVARQLLNRSGGPNESNAPGAEHDATACLVSSRRGAAAIAAACACGRRGRDADPQGRAVGNQDGANRSPLPEMTMQHCTDETTDKQMTSTFSPMSKEICSKNDTLKTATGYTTDSVCTVNGMSMTSHADITGDFNSAYTVKVTSHSQGGAAGAAARQRHDAGSQMARRLQAGPEGRRHRDARRLQDERQGHGKAEGLDAEVVAPCAAFFPLALWESALPLP